MGVRRYPYFSGTNFNVKPVSYYEADLFADLPISGLVMGDIAYAGDTNLLYFRGINGWQAVASGAMVGDIKSDGTIPFAANESMGGFKITNLGTPTASTDASNKSYADTASSMLGKAFFAAQGLLPATTIKEELYTFPTFDAITAGQSATYNLSRAATSGSAYYRFNLGAAYTKVLLIFGLTRQSGQNMSLWMCSTLNGGGVPTDGISFMNESNSNRSAIYHMPDFASFGDTSLVYTAAGANVFQPAMAAYANFTTRRIILFYRLGAEQWWPVLDFTPADLGSGSPIYAGAAMSAGYVGCPMGIYGE